jgi:cysteinyl-tRNA synthetase
MHTLKLYNTLTRQKETFTPMVDGQVKMYTCGPTVYNYAHIGNLRSYIFPDILKKLLTHIGYEVHHIINFTDVGHMTSDADSGDDKVEKAAAKLGKSAWEISEFYAEAFRQDITALNIAFPSKFTYATKYIDEQIDMVKTLEAKGLTYATEDGIYFDTAQFPAYGQMARLDREGLDEGSRVEFKDKRNKTDFALWKFSPADQQRQMEWESPWGKGFPGWHIECSAMIFAELGTQIDIHTGGTDHIPVHHTNEIAQSEGCTGHPFVNYWLHGEFLVLDQNQRMGKSVGNFLTLQTLVDEGYLPLAYRYLALNSHYRSFLTFTPESMKGAQTGYLRLKKAVQAAQQEGSVRAQEQADVYQARILDALLDDLNAPKALGIVWEMLGDETLGGGDKVKVLAVYDTILGLKFFDFSDLERKIEVPAEVLALAQERWQARANKDWASSDRLRDAITALGFRVKDGKDSYTLESLDD